MGIAQDTNFSVFISLEDWKGDHDEGQPVRSEDMAAPTMNMGTKAAWEDNVLAPPPPVPGVSVTKGVDNRDAEPGDYLTYTITIKNKKKAATAAHVWVNDTLPSDVTYISDTSGQTPSVNGNTYSYLFTDLVQGEERSFTMTVQVNGDVQDGVAVVNNVNVDYTNPAGQYYGSDQSSVTTTCKRPDISVTKVADTDSANPGDTITYTIYYNNTGRKKAAHVWVNDTLPLNTTYQSSSEAYDSVNGGIYTWHFMNVAPGDYSFTITVTVNMDAPSGTMTNWANLDYTSSSGFLLETSADSAVVIISELPQLILAIFGIMILSFIGLRKKEEEIT
jgi:uncharacterized repeat protein (TIGR01451 family)